MILLSLFLFFNSLGAAKQDGLKPLLCTAKRWPHARNERPGKLHQRFDRLTHRDLTQYLWYEVSMRPKFDLALPMLQYLIETEKNKDFKSYYQVLGAAAYKTHTPVYQLYAKYTKKKTPIVNKSITVREVCSLYNKIAKDQQ